MIIEMLRTIRHLVLYKNERYYASFPSVATLADGNVLLVFRRARDFRWLVRGKPPRNLEYAAKRVDHIDSRSQLNSILFDGKVRPLTKATQISQDPDAADQDASLLVLANNDVLLTSFSWFPFPPDFAPLLKGYTGNKDITGCFYQLWGANVRLSKDNAKSWSAPQYLPSRKDFRDIVPGRRKDHGGAIRGQAVETDGEILVPTYAGFSKQHRVSTTNLYVSKDNAKTWQYRSMIADDAHNRVSLYEPALYKTEKNRLIAFIRSGGLKADHLVTAESPDNGHTWRKWRENKIKGHPYHPLRLKDGRCLLVYGYRHKPFGIRARVLSPECRNIQGTDEFIIRKDGFVGDLGYPWSTLLPDGRILVVYYFTAKDGIRHIAGSIIKYLG